MARKVTVRVDEKRLSRGQLRKLTALRKSLGGEIADRAFAEWLAKSDGAPSAASDQNAMMIADVLSGLATEGKLMIPRGGYIVRRGRGRLIVDRNAAEV